MGNRPDQFADLDERGQMFDDIPKTAEKQETEDSAEGAVPRARFQEVLEDRKRLEEMVNQFTLSAMRGGSPSSQPQAEPSGEPNPIDLTKFENLDEDSAKDIAAMIELNQQQFAAKFAAEFERAYGPVLANAQRIAQRTEVSESVEGFDEIKDKVAERYKSLPAERKDEYNSRLGIEALTLREQRDALQEQLAALQPRNSSLAGRATLTPANRGGVTVPGASREPEIDVWGMSDEEYQTFKTKNGL